MARRLLDEVENPPTERDERQQDRERNSKLRELRRTSRTRASGDAGPSRRRINLVYWAIPFAALVAIMIAFYAFHRVEAFLINDSRFSLKGESGGGQDLAVSGTKRVSREEVLKVFEKDFGRSLYLFPATERRRNLMAIDWVKNAVISRRWPNQVAVQIIEREPVAIAQFNRQGRAPVFRLIDEDGVALPIPASEKFNLAVLTGLGANQAEEVRKPRVRQAMAMLREIGPELSARISDIDVRDMGNLTVTMKVGNVPAIARIGNHKYRQRLENFVANFPRMHRDRPDTLVWELRVDGSVTASEDQTRAISSLVKSDSKGRSVEREAAITEGTASGQQ